MSFQHKVFFLEALKRGLIKDVNDYSMVPWDGGRDMYIFHKSSSGDQTNRVRYSSGRDDAQTWENACIKLEENIEMENNEAARKAKILEEIRAKFVIDELRFYGKRKILNLEK